METTIAISKIEPTQLEQVVKESGLSIQEADEIKKSYLPFVAQLAETQSQADKINYDNPSEIDETIARGLRLKTVKIRTYAEKLKDERKRMYLLRGNLEQASYNLIAASCKVTEEVFYNIEKAREIAEKKKQIALRNERAEKIAQFVENTDVYPLGIMSEKEFDDLYFGLNSAYIARIESEVKAEKERQAAIKAEQEKQEKIRLENIRLQKEVKVKEKQLIAEKEKEATRLKAIEDEKKVKAEAEKKAKLAPDKTKLLNFMQAINDLPRPEIKSIEAASIMTNANTMLVQAANYIRDNANKL